MGGRESESKREKESGGKCVCVKERMNGCARERVRVSERVCVGECERERGRKRSRAHVPIRERDSDMREDADTAT